MTKHNYTDLLVLAWAAEGAVLSPRRGQRAAYQRLVRARCLRVLDADARTYDTGARFSRVRTGCMNIIRARVSIEANGNDLIVLAEAAVRSRLGQESAVIRPWRGVGAAFERLRRAGALYSQFGDYLISAAGLTMADEMVSLIEGSWVVEVEKNVWLAP